MELRHLRYFVTVADAGSVVQAARELNVAQPALSRQIQALERIVGVTLLERLPHGVRLTRAGKTFLKDARQTLAAARRAMSRARGGTMAPVNRLRVGYGELLAYWRLVADMLHRVRVAHPMLELRAQQMAALQLVAGLREDRIDVALVGVVKWPPRGVDGIRLVDATQTGALLPADHPIAAAEKIRLADLAQLTWFHLPADATLGAYPAVEAAMRRAGQRLRHKTVRAGSFGGLPQIAAGNGFAFANATLAAAITAATTGVVYRPFVDPPLPVWLALLWKKGRRSEPVLDFIDIARKICKVGRDGRPAAP